jgi:hypothetical protein
LFLWESESSQMPRIGKYWRLSIMPAASISKHSAESR